jgi:hypothetical protein
MPSAVITASFNFLSLSEETLQEELLCQAPQSACCWPATIIRVVPETCVYFACLTVVMWLAAEREREEIRGSGYIVLQRSMFFSTTKVVPFDVANLVSHIVGETGDRCCYSSWFMYMSIVCMEIISMHKVNDIISLWSNSPHMIPVIYF